MNRTSAIVTAIFVLAMGLLVVWFFSTFERYEKSVDTGFSAQARSNSMLAAGRMLRKMGVPAEALDPGAWTHKLDSASGTLFVVSRTWTLGQDDLQRLWNWVERGGHLIVTTGTAMRTQGQDNGAAETADDEAEAVEDQHSAGVLLRELGIWRVRDEAGDGHKEPLDVEISGRRYKALFPTRTRLVTDDSGLTTTANDDNGSCIIQGRRGRGQFTAVCTMSAFSNYWIDEKQNATLLWDIISLQSRDAPVWFVFDTDMPPLHLWLWQRIPQTISVAVLIFVLWLWTLTRRAGPTLDVDAPGNRRTLEHIEASGRFVWRYEGGAELLASMRRGIEQAIKLRQPAWAHLPDAERYTKLAEASGLNGDEVFRALATEPRHKPLFLEAVRNLQRLKDAL